MKNSMWTGVFVAAIGMLGMVEFGYAQLRQVGDWPLSLIVSSVGRLIAAQLETCGRSFWLAPLALVATGLLAAAATAWRERRQRATDVVTGERHE